MQHDTYHESSHYYEPPVGITGVPQPVSHDEYRYSSVTTNNRKQDHEEHGRPSSGTPSSSMSSAATYSLVHSAPPAGREHHPTIAVLQQDQMSQSPTTPSPTQNSLPSATEEVGKKRKRAKKEDGEPSEPRRLRRSHEACARCRSKKIKCDSKHPRCTACASANVQCEQEDRHRQTLTPRGYTEGLELKLAICEILLSRRITNFHLNDLEGICAREGIDLSTVRLPQQTPPPETTTLFDPTGPAVVSIASPVSPVTPRTSEVKGQDPHSNDVSQPDHRSMVKSFGLNGPLPQSQQLPHLSQILPPYPVAPQSLNVILSTNDTEDISVGSASLISGRDRYAGGGIGGSRLLSPRHVTDWQIGVFRRASMSSGSTGVEPVEIWLTRYLALTRLIVDVYFERLNIHRPVFDKPGFVRKVEELYSSSPPHQAHLPLPINGYYNRNSPPSDPPLYEEGFICSFYLVLALGTLSEANHSSSPMSSSDKDGTSLPVSWPAHDEFFARALGVKPDLRVTLSSLQALILLHWYLYCELQGRSLWRLVGSLVRLGIELGLHHDPRSQMHYPGSDDPVPVFTQKESALRIRLWGIVLIHDRATSSLLGRPLAIAPNDTNSPRPSCNHAAGDSGFGGDGFAQFSPHFQHSHDLASIQADIVISLYSPNASRNTGGIVRHAIRIMRSLADFRQQLGPRYQKFFLGTGSSSPTSVKMEPGARSIGANTMADLTEDEGLTLLKVGFTRILLLRAIFGNKELNYQFRVKALSDAIATAHNTIHIHNQLISFPSIAFFTSPIPLHINAMVILTGHIWQVGQLERHVAVEDVWLALDMLPRFRWRWERKDWGGEHPFLARMVEMVMRVDLREMKGCSPQPTLIEEREWSDVDENSMAPAQLSRSSSSHGPGAPSGGSPVSTVSSTNRGFASHTSHGYVNGPSSASGAYGNMVFASPPPSGGSAPRTVDIPNQFFYPFFPGQPAPNPAGYTDHIQQQPHHQSSQHSAPQRAPVATGTGSVPSPPDIDAIFMQAAAEQAAGPYGCQPSQETYFSEERDSETYVQSQQEQPQRQHPSDQHFHHQPASPHTPYSPTAYGVHQQHHYPPSSNQLVAQQVRNTISAMQPHHPQSEMLWVPTGVASNGVSPTGTNPQSPRQRF